MERNKNDIDVILIYPRTGFDLGSTVAPPFSSLTIAAPLKRNGIKVRIIDQRVDRNWMKNLEESLKSNPICCGISAMTGTQISFGIDVAKIIRNHDDGGIPIVWGGPHPSILPEQTLRSEYVDIACVGEGEETFLDLVDALSKKRALSEVKGIGFLDGGSYVYTGDRPFLSVEDFLETPWDLVDVESYIHQDLYLREAKRVLDVGQTSRGCPYRCTFCSSASIRRHTWRGMSVEKALNMITENVNRFKLDGIWLRDDEFYLDIERATNICQGMIDNKLNLDWYTSGTRVNDVLRATDDQLKLLKRSGCYVLKIGAESGSDRILKFIRKNQTVEQILEVNQKCKKYGIKPAFSLMCGFPTETIEEINKTIDLFFRIQDENPDASCETIAQYTALPGTEMFKVAVEMGLKPPETFEAWADWLFHEADSKGDRIPWFTRKERKWIANLNYMSILSKTAANVMTTFADSYIIKILYYIAKPVSKYFGWRLRNKYYNFVPEIKPIKAFQQYMFSSTNLFNTKNKDPVPDA